MIFLMQNEYDVLFDDLLCGSIAFLAFLLG